MISRDEWIAALGDAVKPVDPDALSISEIAELFGIHRQAAERKVRELTKAGLAARTWKQITMCSGHMRRVPAYKLLKANATRPTTRRR